ncbi:MAG: phosphatidylinositol glycan-class A, partial [uncultured bacterium]
ILANSDIFVLPTLFEGMSNAILEAMASKLAILTTNISENRELITHNQNGILVKTKSSREIKLWLEKVIDDQKLRLFLGEKAQDQIQKKFGIDVTTRLFSKSINKLINS